MVKAVLAVPSTGDVKSVPAQRGEVILKKASGS